MEVPHCEMRHLQHFFTPVVSSIIPQSYPRGTPCRTRGVRYVVVEGYDF